jgi:phage baseplate assembly protein V
LFVDGRRDNGFILAVDDRRYRLTGLDDGEVAIYTDQGDSIVIRRGGTIEINAATEVQVTSPLATFSGNATFAGNVTVSGTLTATTDVIGGGKSLKTHTHSAGSLVTGSTPVTGISGAPL